MLRFCGLCRGPFLGAMDQQVYFTCEAYQFKKEEYIHWNKQRQKLPKYLVQDLLTEMSIIMYSLKQIIKYVRRQWRSTRHSNPVTAGLMSKLSFCYRMVCGFWTTLSEEYNPRVENVPEMLKTSFSVGIFSLTAW